MKAKTVKVKVKPNRMTRAQRKKIKRAQKAAQELMICRQMIEFHKAYLEIEMEHEEIKYEELQARLAALQAVADTVETVETVEAIETVETVEAVEPVEPVEAVEAPEVEKTVAVETTEEATEAESEPEPVAAE